MRSSKNPTTQSNAKDATLIEDSRIVIRGGKVIIENLSEDLLDLALALNPTDPDLIERKHVLDDARHEDIDGTF